MKRSDVRVVFFFGVFILLATGLVLATVDNGATAPVDNGATAPVDDGATAPVDNGATAPVDPAQDAEYGEPLDPALQNEPAPSDGGGFDINDEGFFGLSWLMIGIIAGGVILFFILLIIIILIFSGKKEKAPKGPVATPVSNSVPSVPGPSSGAVPVVKPAVTTPTVTSAPQTTPVTPAPVSQPASSGVPTKQPTSTVPSAQPATRQAVQPVTQRPVQPATQQAVPPTQQATSVQAQVMTSVPVQQVPPQMQAPVTVQNASNVQYVKYYAQNLSHDPRIRIRYLLSAGHKLVSSGDVNGAKQVYAFIFEDYHHLTYHDDGLYNEIVGFRQKLS